MHGSVLDVTATQVPDWRTDESLSCAPINGSAFALPQIVNLVVFFYYRQKTMESLAANSITESSSQYACSSPALVAKASRTSQAIGLFSHYFCPSGHMMNCSRSALAMTIAFLNPPGCTSLMGN
jgi:hypothetical protein